MAKKRKTNPVKEIVVKEQRRSEKDLIQIRNLTAEFFDHAVILVSREADGKTEFLNTVIGNQFAVKGMIDVFVSQYMRDQMETEMGDEEVFEWLDEDEDGD
jgi:hypothetical protein